MDGLTKVTPMYECQDTATYCYIFPRISFFFFCFFCFGSFSVTFFSCRNWFHNGFGNVDVTKRLVWIVFIWYQNWNNKQTYQYVSICFIWLAETNCALSWTRMCARVNFVCLFLSFFLSSFNSFNTGHWQTTGLKIFILFRLFKFTHLFAFYTLHITFHRNILTGRSSMQSSKTTHTYTHKLIKLNYTKKKASLLADYNI